MRAKELGSGVAEALVNVSVPLLWRLKRLSQQAMSHEGMSRMVTGLSNVFESKRETRIKHESVVMHTDPERPRI
jgi:hypothetical protein